jgi:hypothetical protein
MLQLEELGTLKNSVTSFGIEPTTFLLVAQCMYNGMPLQGFVRGGYLLGLAITSGAGP